MKVAKAYTGKFAPNHVFGDVTYKIPINDKEALQSKLAWHRGVVEKMVGMADVHCQAVERKKAVQSEGIKFIKYFKTMTKRWKMGLVG